MKNMLCKSFISYRDVLGTACALLLLASCEKDMKTTSAAAALSASEKQSAGFTAMEDTTVVDTAGLVAWFSFNNGSLADRSIYQNKIVFNNATLTTDRYGVANNAYYFNGNSSFMRVKNSPSLSPASAISLFAIVKFNGFYGGLCHGNRILNKGYDDGDPGFIVMGAADDYYTHSMNCSQPVDSTHETFESGFCNTGATDTAEFVQTGHWYHLIYTYGNGVASFYVDGKLTDSHAVRLSPSTNTYDLFIGTTNHANKEFPYWLNGSVDQVAVFNRALSANTIAKLSAY